MSLVGYLDFREVKISKISGGRQSGLVAQINALPCDGCGHKARDDHLFLEVGGWVLWNPSRPRVNRGALRTPGLWKGYSHI